MRLKRWALAQSIDEVIYLQWRGRPCRNCRAANPDSFQVVDRWSRLTRRIPEIGRVFFSRYLSLCVFLFAVLIEFDNFFSRLLHVVLYIPVEFSEVFRVLLVLLKYLEINEISNKNLKVVNFANPKKHFHPFVLRRNIWIFNRIKEIFWRKIFHWRSAETSLV